ncbi:MAG: hypothetical protein Q9207_001342 [Kuettlingeria erythrocarpa]
MREIVTLQLGQRANYLATHFWNTQACRNSAGQGPSGEDTYTPRTLIYDLKGGFGSLRKWDGLYDQQGVREDFKKLWYVPKEARIIRNGSVVKQQDAPIPRSEYQEALNEGLEQNCKLTSKMVIYWSDFTRVFYHPRSIIQINDYELGSSILPFEQWSSGEALFDTLDKEHDLHDRDFRPWAEECDQMQAIQTFGSADDAWGGFASRYLESLRDEYGKTAVWFWGLEEGAGQGQKTKQLQRTVNVAQSLQTISSLASMYIPLAVPLHLPPYVNIDEASQWHASGLLSMAVESMTLPSRQKPGSTRRGLLGDIEAALNVNGNQRVAEFQCSIIDPSRQQPNTDGQYEDTMDCRVRTTDSHDLAHEDEIEKTNSMLDMRFSTEGPLQTALSIQQREQANHVFSKVESIRGLPSPGREMREEDEAVSRKRRRLAFLPIVEHFPEILDASMSSTKNAAIHASLSTSSQMSKRMKGLQSTVARMVHVSDREALSNGLGEIAEAYKEGWDSASDEESN